MAADYETRLDRLETAWGVGPTLRLILFPGEDKAARVAQLKTAHGLRDDDPVQVTVYMIKFVEWPLGGVAIE